MTALMGAAMYLVLGLAVVVGVFAAFQSPSLKQAPDNAATPTHLSLSALGSLSALAEIAEQSLGQQGHALPWVIPPSLAPPNAEIEAKKLSTVEEISERLGLLETQIDRIAYELKGKTRSPFA